MKNLPSFEDFINESYVNEANYDKMSLYSLMDAAVDNREAALKLVERSKKKDKQVLLAIWNQLRDEKVFEDIFYGLAPQEKMSFLVTMPEYIKKFGLPNPGQVPTGKFDYFSMPTYVISFLFIDKSFVSDSDKQKVANGLNDKQKELIVNWINQPYGTVNLVIPYKNTLLKDSPYFGKYKDSDYPKNGMMFGNSPMIEMAKEKLAEFGLYTM